MRAIIAILLVFFLCPVSFANEGVITGVVDSDPNGANVRAAPSRDAAIVVVLAQPDEPEDMYARRVTVTGGKGAWFNVTLPDGKTGWMHKSILGFCAGAGENGPCALSARPDNKAAPLGSVPPGAAMSLEEVAGQWARVSYAGKDGKTVTGWLPARCLAPSPGICASGGDAFALLNRTEIFQIISFDIITKDGRKSFSPAIDPGGSMTLPKFAAGEADLDFYMGMPNSVHFFFKQVPLNTVDTLILSAPEFDKPELDMRAGGKSLGRLAGTQTADDLRGDDEEEEKEVNKK